MYAVMCACATHGNGWLVLAPSWETNSRWEGRRDGRWNLSNYTAQGKSQLSLT